MRTVLVDLIRPYSETYVDVSRYQVPTSRPSSPEDPDAAPQPASPIPATAAPRDNTSPGCFQPVGDLQVARCECKVAISISFPGVLETVARTPAARRAASREFQC